MTGRDAPPYAHDGRLLEAPPLELPGLSDDDAAELAAVMSPDDPQRAAQLRRQGGSVPLFMLELSRAEHLPVDSGALDKASLLRLRLSATHPAERELLDHLAVAGRPLPAPMLGADNSTLQRLQKLRIVQSLSPGFGRVEFVHDWLRDALLDEIASARQRDLHLALAERLLDNDETRTSALYHLRQVGNHERLYATALLAAEKAEATLAFSLAASCLALALEHAPADDDTADLSERLAAMLIAAGRGAEAAEVLLALAGRDERDADRHLARAAEQLLFSGHAGRGSAVVRTCLHQVGVQVETSSLRAFASVFINNRRPVLKRLLEDPPPPRPLSDDERRRLDLCYSASLGLSVQSPFPAAALQVRNLLDSLRTGDRSLIARAMGSYAMLMSGYRYRPAWSADLHRRAQAYADDGDDADVAPHLAVCRAATSLFEGRLVDCKRDADDASRLLATMKRRSQWHLDSALILQLSGDCGTGQFNTARAILEEAVNDAAERGDAYLMSNVMVRFAPFVSLAQDRADDALRAIAEGRAAGPQQGIDSIHLFAAIHEAEVHLYQGRPDEAEACLRRLMQSRAAKLASRLHYLTMILSFLSGRIAIAARSATPGADARTRAAVRSLRASGGATALAMADLLEAGVAADAQPGLWTKAASSLEQAGLDHLAWSASRRGGRPSGRPAWMPEEANEARLLSFWAPTVTDCL